MDYKEVILYIDEADNVVIFPLSMQTKNINKETGTYIPSEAMHPFELGNQYTIEELARVIELARYAGDKYPVYEEKKSLLEHYYQIDGYKNAVKGKRMISIDWGGWKDDEIVIGYYFPCKTKTVWISVNTKKLPIDADWLKIAKEVYDLLQEDFTKFPAFKTFKDKFVL